MIIPDQIRVGSTFYTVKAQATPIVMNGMQCYGYCDPNMLTTNTLSLFCGTP